MRRSVTFNTETEVLQEESIVPSRYLKTSRESNLIPELKICLDSRFSGSFSNSKYLFRTRSKSLDTMIHDVPNNHVTTDGDIDCDENISLGHLNTMFVDDEEDENMFVPNLENRYLMHSGANATDIHTFGDGHTIITDMISSKVYIYDSNGRRHNFIEHENLIEPWALAVTSNGCIVMTSRKRKTVCVFSKEGNFLYEFGKSFFQCPCGLSVDRSDHIIVCDCVSAEVSVHNPEGTWLFNLGDNVSPIQQFKSPRYVHVTSKNDIVVSDSGNHCIKIFNERGDFLRSCGSFGKEDGQFKAPSAICSDSNGQLLVADHYNDRISLLTREGDFICHLVMPNHGLLHPQGIALSDDSKLYVTHGKMKANEIVVYTFRKEIRSQSCEPITFTKL